MNEPTSVREALARVDEAALTLFAADPAIRAVGLECRAEGRFGWVATRCGDVARPLASPPPLMTHAAGMPVRHRHSRRSPAQLARAPLPLATGVNVPERRLMRPLPWGAELQNFDADERAGVLRENVACVGTLGCVVTLADGTAAVLSNNHVLADENHGRPGHDRVLQCGSTRYAASHDVARLGAFVTVHAWHGAGSPGLAGHAWNLVDAALAPLSPGVAWRKGYLREHAIAPARTVGSPLPGDRVYKVGRTTRLTRGLVVEIGTTVGPIHYRDGPAYFRRAFAIVGTEGRPFAQPGDSGSTIVREDGVLVGLLFAGTDDLTYACEAENVFQALGCTLA